MNVWSFGWYALVTIIDNALMNILFHWTTIKDVPNGSDQQSISVNDNVSERVLKFDDKSELMRYLYDDATTLLECLKRAAELGDDRQGIGTISKFRTDIEWTSFGVVLKRSRHFGDGLIKLNQKFGNNIGIFSINRPEFVIAQFGCYWHSMVVIPIGDTTCPDAFTSILNEAEIEVIVCDTLDRVQGIISKATHFTHLKYVIAMDYISYSYKSKAKNYKLEVVTIDELEQLGASIKPIIPFRVPKSSDVALICYTDGTTGCPKGVVLTHENIVSAASGFLYQMFEHKLNKSDVYLSYLSLAHAVEQTNQIAMMISGGKMVFYSGDVRCLFDDVQAVKPTVLSVTAPLLNQIYRKIFQSVRGKSFKESLLRIAINSKRPCTSNGKVKCDTDTIWDRLIINKYRHLLGDRIRLICTGYSSINLHVLQVVRSVFGCIIVNSYGQTECVYCAQSISNGKRADSVGPTSANAIIKLEDIPELGCYASEGKGEILVKGPTVSSGYFKNANETNKLFDEDGWLQSGDVGRWDLQDGTLQIIDRKQNLLKLNQGDYIAVEKLGIAYSNSLFVSQIFVYGDSLRPFLVAIIVPDKEYLDSWSIKNHININFYDQCEDIRIKRAVLKDLESVAKKGRFNIMEYIKGIHLSPESFTAENGLLTPTMKIKRYNLRKHFAKIIEDLYKLS